MHTYTGTHPTRTCTRMHMHARACTSMYMHTHACTPHAHMHTTRMRTTRMRTCTHAHMHACAHACTHAHSETPTHQHTHTHAHTHAHTHTVIHTCTNTHAQACTNKALARWNLSLIIHIYVQTNNEVVFFIQIQLCIKGYWWNVFYSTNFYDMVSILWK